MALSKRQWLLPPDTSYLKLNTTRFPLLHTTLKELEPSSFHQADTGTCTCIKYIVAVLSKKEDVQMYLTCEDMQVTTINVSINIVTVVMSY